ncbi:MAG: hypothetical protein GY858_03390 [Candidatus Omnitrophica bacterium]|nr:hypothetical protein [Candidatus Omnitrophota bacterium]
MAKKKKVELKDIAKERLQEIKTKVWPKTKKELERAMKNAKQMIDKGEKHLKSLSEKGIDNTKKLSLSLKREKVYYDLGKVTAVTSKSKWSSTKKIDDLIQKAKDLTREMGKIK